MTFATSGVTAVAAAGQLVTRVIANRQPFGTAVNPQGFDQIAALYLNYRPIGMKLKLNIGITTGAATSESLLVRGYWSQYATAIGTDLGVIQNRFTKTMSVNDGSGFKEMSTYSNLRNVVGYTEQQWNSDPNTIAFVTANPVIAVSYFYHFVYPSGTAAFSYQYDIVGEMEVEFSSPRILLDDGI